MTRTHRVVALVHPPQAPFELGSVTEAFGLDRPGLLSRYDLRICALRPGPVRTTAGFDLLVTEGPEALHDADTVVIPGWQAPDVPPAVLVALRAAHERGTRILALSCAAFVLAETGLLAGRQATTHWRLAAELAARFPDLEVVPDVLYIDHGDVATSAGTAAGIDLCLHIIRADYGAAYAAEVARHMVMPPRREGGQAQYARPAPRRPASTGLAPVLDWASQHLDQPLTVAELARRAGMSERTFTRRFRADLGVSPGQWLLGQRLDAARELLESSELPVDAVAARVGMSSALNLRRHFRLRLGTTPAAYRRTFSAGLPSVAVATAGVRG